MRLLSWKTLWGKHLIRQRFGTRGIVTVAALVLGPSLAGLVGVDFGLGQRLSEGSLDLVHALLAWTTALLGWIVAIFAFGRSGTERRPEAMLLAAALPITAVLDALHGLAAWLPLASEAESVSLFLWTLSRSVMALCLVAGGAVILATDAPRRGTSALITCAAISLVGCAVVVIGLRLGVPQLLSASPLVPRPWDLLPLAAFAIGMFLVFPQIHRERPSLMSYALLLSLVPQIVAQLEAGFGSIRPWDSHDTLAHVLPLFGNAILLGGILLDYIHTQRRHESAIHEFESAQQEIRKQTQELARVDRELGTQSLMRREAERSLRILEMAVQTMSMGVTVTDLEGRILYVNPADARMHGYSVDELLGTSARRYGPDDGDRDADYRPPNQEIHQPWTRVRINVTRDGRLFPVRLVSNTVYDQGEAIAMVTICEDISERKRIEQALERRDRILEAIGFAAETFLADTPWEESVEEVLENLKEATGVDHIRLGRILDPTTVARRIDDTWSDLEGNLEDTVEAAIRLPTAGPLFPRWRAILRDGGALYGPVSELPEEERIELENAAVRSFATVPIFVGAVWLGVLQLEDGNAEREWSQAELDVLRTAARTFGAAIQRRQDEAALAASQAKFQDLLESANDLIQSVSPTGRFQFVNRAWKEALGYGQDEISSLSLWQVIHPDYHQRYTETLTSILVGERRTERVEVVFVGKGGTQIHVEGSLNCRFVDGHPVATRGIFRDITERKMIDRMKQEFISTVSHELRTPLTSIIASLGLLQSGRLDLERSEELIVVAHRNGQRLLQLINDLLDLQKLALGKITFRLGPVDLASLLDEAVEGIRSFAASYEIELVVEQVDAGLEALADRDRLIQVLNNLLSNAIKFSPKGESVALSAVGRAGRVVISVADHGPGIPKEFEARLFEKFTQVDSSATRKSGGSGLGLSIVKGLVEGMDGRIDVESEIGSGTTFSVDLPVYRAAKANSSRRVLSQGLPHALSESQQAADEAESTTDKIPTARR